MGATERYLLGELDEVERSAFEEHFFDCRECAEEVKAGAIFLENARKVLAEEQAEARVAKPLFGGWASLFWPIPAGAAIAATLLLGTTLYLSMGAVPRLQRRVDQAEGLQAAPWQFLAISRAEPQTISVPKGMRMVGITLSRSSTEFFPYYRCEIRTADGAVVDSTVIPAPKEGDEIQILLPAWHLPNGKYVIALGGLNAPDGPVAAPDVAQYHFTLQHAEE